LLSASCATAARSETQNNYAEYNIDCSAQVQGDVGQQTGVVGQEAAFLQIGDKFGLSIWRNQNWKRRNTESAFRMRMSLGCG
jgi:hypothetical protein